jgi:hypothetical protein
MCNRKIKFFKNKNVNKDKINSMKILNKMIDSQVLENNLYFENIFK